MLYIVYILYLLISVNIFDMTSLLDDAVLNIWLHNLVNTQ